jgi:hypothetical protein
MTPARLVAIGFIYLCTTVAWFVLGGTVVARTGDADGQLREEVARLWGGRHVQEAPSAWWEETRDVARQVEETDTQGNRVLRTVVERVVDKHPAPFVRTRAKVALSLDYRRKGLLWYDTYGVRFAGDWIAMNPDPQAREILVHFAFPSREGIYDGFRFRVAGQDAPPADDLSAGVTARVVLPPGGQAPVEVRYRSRGLDDWTYSFGPGVSQIRDFDLALDTDFDRVDFPAGAISPERRIARGEGQRMTWRFESLVTGQKVAVDLPGRLNPGPLAARISFFAPVSLLFFVTILVIQGVLRRRSLHPMNYFFLSAAFFAFHLLLAYLVDHVDIYVAFAAASAVSVALVISYLRLVSGMRFAILEAGAAQVVFLVLFGWAFFFEGYTGLTITAGAILTLFVLMQLTGRVDWARTFARGPAAE